MRKNAARIRACMGANLAADALRPAPAHAGEIIAGYRDVAAAERAFQEVVAGNVIRNVDAVAIAINSVIAVQQI